MPGWTKPQAAAPFPAPPAWGPAAPGANLDLGGMPADRSGEIFAAAADQIRRALAGCTVIDWRDASQLAEPGTDGPSWVRLTPSAGPAEPLCVDPELGGLVSSIPLLVGVETSTAGANPLASAALWGAIRGAIFPISPALDALGVCRVGVRQVPLGSPLESKAQARCEGAGLIELTAYFVTPQ